MENWRDGIRDRELFIKEDDATPVTFCIVESRSEAETKRVTEMIEVRHLVVFLAFILYMSSSHCFVILIMDAFSLRYNNSRGHFYKRRNSQK